VPEKLVSAWLAGEALGAGVAALRTLAPNLNDEAAKASQNGHYALVSGDQADGRTAVVSHLRLLIDEEASLSEVPARSTIVRSDSVETAGPWDAPTCSTILLRWLRAGLIGLYRADATSEAIERLSEAEAFVALDRYEGWFTRDPVAYLLATETGACASDDEWVSALEDD
jgi:hypothetical protein